MFLKRASSSSFMKLFSALRRSLSQASYTFGMEITLFRCKSIFATLPQLHPSCNHAVLKWKRTLPRSENITATRAKQDHTIIPHTTPYPVYTPHATRLVILLKGASDLSWPARKSRFTPTPLCGVDPSLGWVFNEVGPPSGVFYREDPTLSKPTLSRLSVRRRIVCGCLRSSCWLRSCIVARCRCFRGVVVRFL